MKNNWKKKVIAMVMVSQHEHATLQDGSYSIIGKKYRVDYRDFGKQMELFADKLFKLQLTRPSKPCLISRCCCPDLESRTPQQTDYFRITSAMAGGGHLASLLRAACLSPALVDCLQECGGGGQEADKQVSSQ